MPITPLRQLILDEASSLRGIPYRINPPPDGVNNLDCSLFVVVTFRRAGIPFPPGVRIAEAIRQACDPIEWRALQAGDLIFFEHTYDADHTPGPDGKIATHVGISCGAGTFKMWDCHASNGESGPPGVGETDLTLPYWQSHLMEARRPPSLAGESVIEIHPETEVGTGERLRVIGDGVRLRREPGLSGAILTSLNSNAIVVALTTEPVARDGHTWRHVQTGSRTGWMSSMYLAQDVPSAGNVGRKLRSADNGVRLRQTPRLTGRILTHLSAGAIVVQRAGDTPSHDNHIWIPVALGSIEGWVAEDLLETVSDTGHQPPPLTHGVLSVDDLFALVRAHGAAAGLDQIMVAAALTESGGNPTLVGDNGHSVGLWQMHDQGLGAGMTLEERTDPNTACATMLPHFRQVHTTWTARGLAGEELATQTYLWTERPFNYNVPGNDAELAFRKHWRRITA